MQIPKCNHRGGAFNAECGAPASITLITEYDPNAPAFQVACVKHRGELSRLWPDRLFWEVI